MEYEVQESLDIISARLVSFEQERCVEAFIIQQGALISSLKAKSQDFDNVFSGLKKYITKMQPEYFATGTEDEIKKKIAYYIEETQRIDLEIKAFDNYCSIKYEYEHIMRCFYTRLDKAKQNLPVSQEEIEEIMK